MDHSSSILQCLVQYLVCKGTACWTEYTDILFTFSYINENKSFSSQYWALPVLKYALNSNSDVGLLVTDEILVFWFYNHTQHVSKWWVILSHFYYTVSPTKMLRIISKWSAVFPKVSLKSYWSVVHSFSWILTIQQITCTYPHDLIMDH